MLGYQFRVLIFGSKSSPFILSQVLDTHLSASEIPIANLASYFYVDNFVKTYSEESELIAHKPIIDSILEDANMPLRGWISNNQAFNSTYEVTETKLQKVLGLQWDTDSDCLKVVDSKKFLTNFESWIATKRSFLSALVSVYDPLGLISPVILQGKLFLQMLWKQKVSWDTRLSIEYSEQAIRLLQDLQ